MAAVRGNVILYNSSLQLAANINTSQGIPAVSGPIYQNGVLIGGTPVVWGVGAGSSSIPTQWYGGRTMVHVAGPTFPPVASGVQVQQLQPDGATWLTIGSGVIPANIIQTGMWSIDTSPGQYRVFSNSGVISGLCVQMTGVSYGQ